MNQYDEFDGDSMHCELALAFSKPFWTSLVELWSRLVWTKWPDCILTVFDPVCSSIVSSIQPSPLWLDQTVPILSSPELSSLLIREPGSNLNIWESGVANEKDVGVESCVTEN